VRNSVRFFKLSIILVLPVPCTGPTPLA